MQLSTNKTLWLSFVQKKRVYQFHQSSIYATYLYQQELPTYFWCGYGDLNPNTFRSMILSHCCLPVPAYPHMVGEMGFEPTWYNYRGILSPLRLPIPPLPHILQRPNNLHPLTIVGFALVTGRRVTGLFVSFYWKPFFDYCIALDSITTYSSF